MLPRRRKPQRSGIQRAPKRLWPRHRKFVRSHDCCVPGCVNEAVIFAHVRLTHTAGGAQKPFDWLGVSLCSGINGHHEEQHNIGHLAFDRKYGIDSLKLAAEFAARSPDTAMREVMRASGA